MFLEDMTVFFADFGKPVVWAPGGSEPQQTMGLLDSPDEFVLSDRVIVSTTAKLTYAVGQLVGLAENHRITVDGKPYRVRQQPKQIDDGRLIETLIAED
jgi:hypothetical protein